MDEGKNSTYLEDIAMGLNNLILSVLAIIMVKYELPDKQPLLICRGSQTLWVPWMALNER